MLAFSVIIPTLNEEPRIAGCISAVRALEPEVEIIVADGESSDATLAVAQAAGARVCRAPRGRGSQCNAGATVAGGEVFIFLHADTRLPVEAFPLLRDIFRDERSQIGAFQIWFDGGNWLLNTAARFSRFDTILTSFGDQCIVVRRDFFEGIGRFPAWPLFEDVNLLQRARRETRVIKFPAKVVSSARRFRAGGNARQLLRNGWFMLQYLLGVPPAKIAAAYERTRPDGG